MTEANGNKVVKTDPDPTLNVRELVDAAILRLDDLRECGAVRVRENISAVGELLGQSLVAERRRGDDLRTVDICRIDEHIRERIADLRREISLRAEHSKELATAVANAAAAEKGRVDANNLSIREAAIAANKEAADRASALANQLVATAEAARVAVSQTTTQIDGKITTMANSINERFGTIERSINLGEGRNLGPDPALAELISEMKQTRLGQAKLTGSSAVGNSLMVTLAGIGASGAVAVLLALTGHLQ